MAVSISSNEDEVYFDDIEKIEFTEWLENALRTFSTRQFFRHWSLVQLNKIFDEDKTPLPKNRDYFKLVLSDVRAFTVKDEESQEDALRESVQILLDSESDLQHWRQRQVNDEETTMRVTVTCHLQGDDDEKIETQYHLRLKVIKIVRIQGTLPAWLLNSERESLFYMKIAPFVEDYGTYNGYKFQLPIPHCYMGEFHKLAQSKSKSVRTTRSWNPISRLLLGLSRHKLNLDQEDERFNVNSILIVDDLEQINFRRRIWNRFGYRHNSLESMLTVDEARLTLERIAALHGVTWAMQINEGCCLHKKWPNLLTLKETHELYSKSIHEGFPNLLRILPRTFQKYKNMTDLGKFNNMEPRLSKTVKRLDEILGETCLDSKFLSVIHSDLRPSNLWFEYNTNNIVNDVKIVNWSVVSIGNPIHDVAFLLFTCLDPETRRKETIDLLETYWDAFLKSIACFSRVKIPFEFEDLIEKFNQAFFLSVLIVVGNLKDVTHFDRDLHADLKIILEGFQDVIELGLI